MANLGWRSGALLLLLVGGCGGGGSKTKLVANQAVGNTGGMVSTTSGTSIAVPPGAVTGNTEITISTTTAEPTSSAATPVSESFLFGPEGAQFATPVEVRIPFDASKIPSGGSTADLVILTAPKDSPNFVRLETTVDGNFLVAKTSHFSVFLGAYVPGSNC